MNQDVTFNTAGTGSTIKTDLQLKYLQDIVKPDDTTNTNNGRQFVSLRSGTGGIIDTTSHDELGYSLQQTLNDIDDRDNTQSTPISAKNLGYQILGIDSDNSGANINFDTNGLSTISQLIDGCKFSTTGTTATECLNSAGTPSETAFKGQVTQLTANGAGDVANDGNDGLAGSPGKPGTNINLDNQKQVIDQEIINFHDANGRDATNIIDETAQAQGQYFEVRAAAGGDVNMALDDVDEQTQSIKQSITDSIGNARNEVKAQTIPITVPVTTQGSNGQAIYIGDDPGTPTRESVQGYVEADVDQELEQSISGVTSTNTQTSSNTGTMVMTLLARDGASKLFVEGFNQYLKQTADCNNCQTSGQVYATFDVAGASQLTLLPGSTQGLTQTATNNNAVLTNTVYDKITVTGGAGATIFLDHQIENVNGVAGLGSDGNGVSQFTGTYTGAPTQVSQNCVFSTNNAFTQSNCTPR